MALIQCPECGNKISDKVRTCPFCNTLINPASAPVAPTPAPTPAPAAAPAPAPTPAAAPTTAAASAPAPAPAPATTPAPAPAPAPVAPPVAPYPYPQQRASSTGKWIVLGVVIALVVILLGIFIALLALNYLKVAPGSPVVVEEMVAPQTPAPAPVMPHTSGSVPGIYPEGSTRYLTYSDVAGKSKWELRIMRNEIYARHNYVFKSPDLIQYFNRQPWYTGYYPDAAYVYTLFSQMEIKNIELIKAYE